MTTDKHNKRPNVPPLRFPEFTEPWETAKLGDMTVNFSKRNKDEIEYPMYSVTNNRGFIPQSEQFEDREMVSSDIKSYKIITKGDFAYNPARINVGSIAKYNGDNDCMISSLYVAFRAKEQINAEWLMQLLKTPKMNFYYNLNAEGGVRMYLFYPNFERIRTSYPSLNEQRKVAQFLDLLDHRIAVQSGLIEDLQKLKAALVERLFCNKQSWKQYKYRDLLSPISERNSENQFSNVLSASQELGMVNRTDLDIDIKFERSAVTTYKIVRDGDYVLHLRSFQGGLAFSSMTGICSPAYTILRPVKELEYGFFQEYFMSKSFINSLRLVTYGIRDGRSINVDEFLDMPVEIPDSATQCRIISILSIMNRRLRLGIKQKENYIKQKQYLLQQMFI